MQENKNLKEILALSKLQVHRQFRAVNNSSEELGCFKCNGRCDLCIKFLMECERFWSNAIGRSYKR